MYVCMWCGLVVCVCACLCVEACVCTSARIRLCVCVHERAFVYRRMDLENCPRQQISIYVYGRSDAYMTYTSYVYVCMYGQRYVNFGYPRCCFGGWPWCHGSPWSPGCRGQPAAGPFMPAKPHMTYFLKKISMCECAQSHDFGDARCGLGIGI